MLLQAETFFGGVSVDQLSDMKANNMDAYDKVFDDAMFQTWLCRVRNMTMIAHSSYLRLNFNFSAEIGSV